MGWTGVGRTQGGEQGQREVLLKLKRGLRGRPKVKGRGEVGEPFVCGSVTVSPHIGPTRGRFVRKRNPGAQSPSNQQLLQQVQQEQLLEVQKVIEVSQRTHIPDTNGTSQYLQLTVFTVPPSALPSFPDPPSDTGH